MIVMAANKQRPIQIHNLDVNLHNFIINGKVNDFKIEPEMLLHLAKITDNNGWLGWSIPTVSRSTRAMLMLELAFIVIKQPLSEITHKTNTAIGDMQSDMNKTAVKNEIIEESSQIKEPEPQNQARHMDNTRKDHAVDKAEQPMNAERRNEIRSAFM